jgi:hypothetical protein
MLDMKKVKDRLEALKTTSNKSVHLWKPTGKSVIRIVPYKHNPENPFIELLFHFGINNKTYLSPSTFNRPDPIVEFANKLKKSGDKESWKKGRSLEPKLRTYVPILVRGEEEKGVRFWGMGKTVYQELLGVIADPDYGDITDLKTGRDIAVEFKTAEEVGKSFPETSIRVKPNQTPAFDPKNAVVMDKVKNQIDILELFPELTYEELAKVMDEWLNAPESEETPEATTATESTEEPSSDDAGEAATVAAPAAATVTAPAAKSPVAVSGKKAVAGAADVAAEFEELFKK